MGRRLFGIIAVLTVGAYAVPAYAEIQETPNSLPQGHLGLGLEFQAEPRGPLSFLLHQAVGLAGGLDLYAREGIPILDPRSFYFGAGIKWSIFHDKPDYPGFALWLGGHYWTEGRAGADVTALIGHTFQHAAPYGGLKYDLDFGGGDVTHKLRLLLGVRLPIVNHFSWFVEGGVGLVGEPKPHFISTGPRFVL